jgi:hypothetical protein
LAQVLVDVLQHAVRRTQHRRGPARAHRVDKRLLYGVVSSIRGRSFNS